MQYYKRQIKPEVLKTLEQENGLVVILYGPRQAGKTTLMQEVLKGREKETLWVNGDDIDAQNKFSRHSLEHLKGLVGDKKILAIDEAQKIDNIGLSLKLLVDNLKIKILVSGSASFDLAHKLAEPLTGRTRTFWMYPLSVAEIGLHHNWQLNKNTLLSKTLLYGAFPKTFNLSGESDIVNYLYDYVGNYLYRDILSLGLVRKPKKVLDLLSLLALQIGGEVSINELASTLAVNRQTVENYLEVLEKLFVIFNLKGFSRNLRKEISKTSKYYFYDLGVRNAVIRNFNEFNLRSDAGQLLENFFIMEKIKMSNNQNKPANFYFWRTYDQKEIDLIEERAGKLTAYEVKWYKKTSRTPDDFLSTYPNSEFIFVNKENFQDYLQ
ncbi:MAG: ATP-binding protein [Patescibacteria group bacterium]